MSAAILKLADRREALKKHIAAKKERHKGCGDAEARHKMLTTKQLRLEIREEKSVSCMD